MRRDNQAHLPDLQADLEREPELDRSQDSAPARTERPSYLERVRQAHRQQRAAKLADDVLAAFAAGRSAELDPRAERDTLTSLARRAGWGGGC